MARTQTGFRQGRPRIPRRLTGWEEGPGGSTLSTVSDSIATILGSGTAYLQDGLTLVRLRGYFRMFLTTAGAAEGFHCALGAAIVSNDAFAVGVTAVPNPIADMDWDGWLYHRFFDVFSLSTLAAGDNNNWVGFEVDSKAMRKVGVNDTLFMSLETVEIGTCVGRMTFDSRQLVKLP